jgi:hypothetical protein
MAMAQQDSPAKRAFPRLPIKLLVENGKDSSVNDMVRGYALDELSKINDIDVVQDNELLCIHCMVLPTTNGLGMRNGYVLCFVLTSQLPNIVGSKLVDSSVGFIGISADKAAKIKQCLKNDGIYAGELVRTCPIPELKQAIADTVASINGGDFQQLRQITTNQ